MSNEENKETIEENTKPQSEEVSAEELNANPTDGIAAETANESNEEKLMRERDDWKDKYMRLYAEFDNFRKRSSKEKSEYLMYASADLMKELLPVLDDFERAMAASEANPDPTLMREGMTLIHNKFARALDQKGLKGIDSTNKTFDVDFHEAITKIAAPTHEMKGKVVDTIEKGYALHDKVIRYAKVVIGE
ncbi:MAG: nucleotide exchange factor GrpE [Flavobacteriales bacterium]|nr:nucleotide exchange factor GrpE [Flavobacteriales bacterium]